VQKSVQIQNTFWSPNQLDFRIMDVEKALKDTLVINQNYYPGWIVMTGDKTCKRAISYNGLLATRLDMKKVQF
jgi:hypothetical protein